jgi:hypothetical protein
MKSDALSVRAGVKRLQTAATAKAQYEPLHYINNRSRLIKNKNQLIFI